MTTDIDATVRSDQADVASLVRALAKKHHQRQQLALSGRPVWPLIHDDFEPTRDLARVSVDVAVDARAGAVRMAITRTVKRVAPARGMHRFRRRALTDARANA